MPRHHHYGRRTLHVLGAVLGLACGDGSGSSTSFATGGSTSSTTGTESVTSVADEGSESGGIKLDVGAPTGDPPACDELEDDDPTSLGCRFYAIDADVTGGIRPFGVSVGNPWGVTVRVTIEDMRGPGLREIVSFEVEPYASEIVKVNGDRGILDLVDHGINTPGVNQAAAFRITSDVPVTAMQINPVGGGPSAVSDASLLLPVNALDTAYIGLGYEQASVGYPGWITIVATEDGTTVDTPQGQAVLDEFDAFHLTVGDPGDVTGIRVDADKPVAAFSGGFCAFIPNEYSFCDHIEEQLFPLSTWGTKYVGARHPVRLPDVDPTPELVYWRVVAAVPGTQIQLEPPVAGNGGQIGLAAQGDWVEFATTESFVATGNEPFMLVQYMGGCAMVVTTNGGCYEAYNASGDPYMLQMVPVDQWLTSVPFLTDTSYPRDFAVFTREAGTEIVLDCLGAIPDDHFTPIVGTEYEVGHVDLDLRDRSDPELVPEAGGEGECEDGQQYATAGAPVGLFVGGLDFAASYGYPAGMGLTPTWVPPAG